MSAVDLRQFSDVRVLAGTGLVETAPMRPFDCEACLFLDEVSKTLMADARARAYPDAVSFAYWCRRGNVQREKMIREGGLGNRLGRGLALHIAPSNVPVNFAFSYAFSLLAGNAAIVRCPSKAFDQVEAILRAMQTAFSAYPKVARRSAFVTYPSSGATTAELSRVADLRVIWGGDDTVETIRTMPTKPRCVDIAFADRYSVAMLSAAAVRELDDGGLAKLARSFYNDTYLMDQNACSSPQTVLWVGDKTAVDRAREAFWGAVWLHARDRYPLQAAVAVDKHVQLCGDVARGAVSGFEERAGVLTTAWIADGQPISTELRGVGGFFYEAAVAGLSDIAQSVDGKYQTLVQFGFDSEALKDEILSLGLTGIDRVVPVGSAMDISLVWDGYDLIGAMSRAIDARQAH